MTSMAEYRKKLTVKNVQGCTFLEPPWMAVIPFSSDVFCLQKTRVQILTRMSKFAQR